MKILIEESVLRQALEALIDVTPDQTYAHVDKLDEAIAALRTALDAAEKVELVPKSKLPERIYLQADEEEWYGDLVWKEVTWSADQVSEGDLCFIREDLIHLAPAVPEE